MLLTMLRTERSWPWGSQFSFACGSCTGFGFGILFIPDIIRLKAKVDVERPQAGIDIQLLDECRDDFFKIKSVLVYINHVFRSFESPWPLTAALTVQLCCASALP
jgi:hypothetical protein